MSDQRERRSERDSPVDPEAAARAQRERCRRGEHTFSSNPRHLYRTLVLEEGPDAYITTEEFWRLCSACRHRETVSVERTESQTQGRGGP